MYFDADVVSVKSASQIETNYRNFYINKLLIVYR